MLHDRILLNVCYITTSKSGIAIGAPGASKPISSNPIQIFETQDPIQPNPIQPNPIQPNLIQPNPIQFAANPTRSLEITTDSVNLPTEYHFAPLGKHLKTV